MVYRGPLLTTLTALLIGSAASVDATGSCATDAMLVFDGSASMGEISFNAQAPTRLQDARLAMHRAMPQIAPFRRVGLLVYGPGGDTGCTGIDLRFAPVPEAADQVVGEIDGLEPNGLTPIAASVRIAAEALDYQRAPGIVVLVTDGNETCGGRPCALGEELAQSGADLTVHVIGFKVVYDPFSWNSPEAQSYDGGKTVAKCLADHTGGMFVSTETVDELVDALRETLGCALIGQTQPQARRHHG
ncbi:MAG: VWA domain-containing protein [Pseudomonadota bacterium]